VYTKEMTSQGAQKLKGENLKVVRTQISNIC
jgi:hypothetical protein